MATPKKPAEKTEAFKAPEKRAEKPEAEPRQERTKMIPGGRYRTSSGVLVNAWKQPIDEHGKILDATPLPARE